MKLVGMLPYERILVGNIANGERFETYAIPSPAGSREVCLNGATARLGKAGDLRHRGSQFAPLPSDQP